MRDLIISEALAKAFPEKEKEKLDKRGSELGEKARIAALGGPAKCRKAEELGAELDKLCAGLVRTNSSISVNFAGNRTYFELGISRVGPGSATFTADHKLTAEFRKLEADKDARRKRYRAARDAVSCVVHSVTTVAKLVKVWPEVKPFLPPCSPEGKTGLPAVQTDVVNKLLGITK
jgi:hypothetical protein